MISAAPPGPVNVQNVTGTPKETRRAHENGRGGGWISFLFEFQPLNLELGLTGLLLLLQHETEVSRFMIHSCLLHQKRYERGLEIKGDNTSL